MGSRKDDEGRPAGRHDAVPTSPWDVEIGEHQGLWYQATSPGFGKGRGPVSRVRKPGSLVSKDVIPLFNPDDDTGDVADDADTDEIAGPGVATAS